MGKPKMLKLSGRAIEMRNITPSSPRLILRVSERPERPRSLRAREAFLASAAPLPEGFGVYVATEGSMRTLETLAANTPVIVLDEAFHYLADGDVIRVTPTTKEVRSLYRRGSNYNHFLTTERCNHYCLMCSQPPKDIDDAWIADDILALIPLIDPSCREIAFTGGEPTLLDATFFRILREMRNYLPRTAVHILSNGRMFAKESFVRTYAEIEHPDMMIGIPIYSDISSLHDYVVQSDGAFDETLRGILNLKRHNQQVEIRVVVHQQTYARLPQLAEFIARNLTFVDHVAMMGLEITGFTRANLESLWIDPIDYQKQLYRAVTLLADHRVKVSIYNHQLCILDRRLWPFARKSISDWKNEYVPECKGCRQMDNCGGFFSSAKLRYSKHIRPLGEEVLLQ
jgi:His-Xaa-Ser system radical SAM maturase HxsC